MTRLRHSTAWTSRPNSVAGRLMRSLLASRKRHTQRSVAAMAPSRNAGIAALASGRRAAVGVRPRGPGSRELAGEYGLGALLATVVWEELGDTRRFTSSRHAVRHTGLDVSVYDSDGKQQSLPTLTLPGVDGLHASLREQVAV
jgi:hypothetical protein